MWFVRKAFFSRSAQSSGTHPYRFLVCVMRLAQSLKMEWVIVVDNSGSMVRHEWSLCETLTLVIEFLRKLECQFAVVRVGAAAAGSQKVQGSFLWSFAWCRSRLTTRCTCILG